MSGKPLWEQAGDQVAEAIKGIGEPLTDSQAMVLRGSLGVWMDKARQTALEEAASVMRPALRSMISRGEAAATILELKEKQ